MISIKFFLQGQWQTINCAQRGIVPGLIVEKHLAEYQWSFRHVTKYDHREFALYTPIQILDGATMIFTGCVTKTETIGSPQTEGINYLVESWWYAITLFTLKLQGIPRVVFNARPDDPQYDSSRANQTVSQILATVLSIISESGLNLQQLISAWTVAHFGTAWGGFSIHDSLDLIPPKTTFEAENLQQIIKSILKWAPDAGLQIDRTDGTFHFYRRASTTIHSITLNNFNNPADDTNLASIRINPRLDLVVPRIILYFPVREEFYECYRDHDLMPDEPEYLVNIPETVTALDDLRFQVSHMPIHEMIEIVGGGDFTFSQSSGIVTFKEHPASFYIRYVAEESQSSYDTGYGGNGYTDYGVERPIVERYLEDFPILIRKFYVLATDPNWILAISFGESYPDPDMWPEFIGKAISKVGGGSSTIAEIAVHQFDDINFNNFVSLLGLGIRSNADLDLDQGEQIAITVEDRTAAVAALADGVWRALRDVRWDGELPTFRWMPELKIYDRINLLNTNDTKMATMQEVIQELNFDLNQERTRIIPAANPYLDLDDLLSIIRQKIPPQNFIPGNRGSGGDSGGKMKVHKHNSASAEDGGNVLKPSKIAMAGATETTDEFRLGSTTSNGIRAYIDGTLGPVIACGDPSGDYAIISKAGFKVKYGAKTIVIGNIGSQLDIEIDGISYLFTHSSTRKLSAKVK